MTIIVKHVHVGATLEQRIAYLRGPVWRQLGVDIGKDMGDQARVNIDKMGRPGGKWQQLSGFMAASRSKHAVVPKGTTAKQVDYRRRRVSRIRSSIRKATKAGQDVSGLRASLIGLAHLGYARRKARGKTPGHGLHGADVRLRDTNSMYDGMGGRMTPTTDGMRIEMFSDGQHSSRDISNDELFRAHATGAGNLPVRNPGDGMALFERVTGLRVRAFMAALPK